MPRIESCELALDQAQRYAKTIDYLNPVFGYFEKEKKDSDEVDLGEVSQKSRAMDERPSEWPDSEEIKNSVLFMAENDVLDVGSSGIRFNDHYYEVGSFDEERGEDLVRYLEWQSERHRNSGKHIMENKLLDYGNFEDWLNEN